MIPDLKLQLKPSHAIITAPQPKSMFQCELTRFQITPVWSEDILDDLSSLCVEGWTGSDS